MQTRRDQLQAYRFQNRRALAALVTGEPNVLEPPMRRLTVTTLSGIMIAILIAAGFAAVGIIHPSAGDSWKNGHAVIVDNDNSTTYVYLNDKLYPVVNSTSGVLAVSGSQSGGGNGSVSRIQVSSGDISGAAYGPEIGRAVWPSALPSASSLLRFPMSVCSVARVQGSLTLAKVTLRIGHHAVDRSAIGADVPASHGIVVKSPRSPEFVLTDGERLQLPSKDVASALGFDSPPLVVGTAFLDSIPLGGTLSPPSIPGSGNGGVRVNGVLRPVGTILHTADTDENFILLRGGLQRLNPVEAALFAGSVTPVRVTSAVTDSLDKVSASVDNPITEIGRALPVTIPHNDDQTGDRTGACAIYGAATTAPRFTLTPDSASDAQPNVRIGEDDTSSSGNADKVLIPATYGVLATPANDPHTVVVISDQGRQYAFASKDLLAGFGYTDSDVVKMPAALLALIPTGPGLSTEAARRTLTR